MHSELSWHCRLHPNVRKVYAALYQNEELVTGVDCVFFTQVPAAARAVIPPHLIARRTQTRPKVATRFGLMPTRTSGL
jgi:hypothetical protein